MSDANNKDIETLIALFETSDWQELSLKIDNLRLFLSKDARANGLDSTPATPAPSSAPAPDGDSTAPRTKAKSSPQEQPGDGQQVIRAANVGTFYRAPKPGEPPYVEVGDTVSPETEVCLIEVMKLFTPQQAGVAGILRQVCVEDAQMVEYDQPLFYVDPKE